MWGFGGWGQWCRCVAAVRSSVCGTRVSEPQAPETRDPGPKTYTLNPPETRDPGPKTYTLLRPGTRVLKPIP